MRWIRSDERKLESLAGSLLGVWLTSLSKTDTLAHIPLAVLSTLCNKANRRIKSLLLGWNLSSLWYVDIIDKICFLGRMLLHLLIPLKQNACSRCCSSWGGESEAFLGCHSCDCGSSHLVISVSSVLLPRAGSAGRGGSAEKRSEPQERRMQGHAGGKCERTSAATTATWRWQEQNTGETCLKVTPCRAIFLYKKWSFELQINCVIIIMECSWRYNGVTPVPFLIKVLQHLYLQRVTL